MEFELSGKAGWAGVGFSDDRIMVSTLRGYVTRKVPRTGTSGVSYNSLEALNIASGHI